MGSCFRLRQKSKDDSGEFETPEITVYDYFVNYRKIELNYSGELPCINVGKPKKPTFFPIELCSLVSLQRYTKALNTLQRSSLVEKYRCSDRYLEHRFVALIPNFKCAMVQFTSSEITGETTT